ncbi:hypothetical protein ACLOJK_038608, partial [Asimina triloba]
ISVMSGAALFIKDDLKLDDTKIEVLMGIINLYSLVGSAVASRTSDWIGRHWTLIVDAIIFFLGAVLMAVATNYAFLMIGRRACLHRRSRPGLLPRLPHLLPRSLHQPRRLAQLRLQLRLRQAPRAPQLANDARSRSSPARLPSPRSPPHARIAAMADHARPAGRSQKGVGPDVGQQGRG